MNVQCLLCVTSIMNLFLCSHQKSYLISLNIFNICSGCFYFMLHLTDVTWLVSLARARHRLVQWSQTPAQSHNTPGGGPPYFLCPFSCTMLYPVFSIRASRAISLVQDALNSSSPTSGLILPQSPSMSPSDARSPSVQHTLRLTQLTWSTRDDQILNMIRSCSSGYHNWSGSTVNCLF